MTGFYIKYNTGLKWVTVNIVILEVETKGLNKLYPIKPLGAAFKSSKKYKLYISTRLKNAKLLLLYEKNIFDYLNSLG